jgi:hypothetical protein
MMVEGASRHDELTIVTVLTKEDLRVFLLVCLIVTMEMMMLAYTFICRFKYRILATAQTLFLRFMFKK